MHTVYLSLGSNLGNKKQYLKQGIQFLAEDESITIKKVSSYYKTAPIGGVQQDDFVNLAVEIKTSYSPLTLLESLQFIEKKLERTREIHWGPRTIDIDILYYDQIKVTQKNLIIPHKEIMNRLFVIVPLLEIITPSFYQYDLLKEHYFKLQQDSEQVVEKMGKENQSIEDNVRDILVSVGEDPFREGLIETPKRIANMYEEIFSSQQKGKFTNYKIFQTDVENDEQMITIKDIPFYSMCEHHMLPFFGKVHVGYFPTDGKIIGLSKIPRLVDFVSKKLNVQENITMEIAMTLKNILNPQGVAVIVEALSLIHI